MAAPGPSGGSWSHEAHGGSGATLCQEMGVGAMGHVAVPELPRGLVVGAEAMRHVATPELSCARRREPEPWGTWAYVPIVSFILTWSLYPGVTGRQGTNSGPQAHLGRGCEPVGGASILSRADFLSFVCWDFEAWQIRGSPRSARDIAMFGAPGGIVTRCSSPWAITAQRESQGPRQS
jgi:hypothetical protein